MTTPAPKTWPLIWTVARREIVVKLQDKAFRVSTAFLLLIMGASVVIPQMLTEDRPSFQLIHVGSEAEELFNEVSALALSAKEGSGVPEADISALIGPDRKKAEELLRNGSGDVLVSGSPREGYTVLATKEVPPELEQLLARASYSLRLSDGLSRIGADEKAVKTVLLEASTPPKETVQDKDAQSEETAMYLFAAFAIVFLMTNMIFGVSIAQSVVEEKQSRVVEILVAAVPVRILLAGKVIGNTIMVMGQLLLLLAVGGGISVGMGQSVLTDLLGRNSGWFVAFFLLGFVMLACLWAVAGSLASRVEDLNATTVPMQMLLIVPFFAAIYLPENSGALKGLSFAPLFSPVVMPRRLLSGEAVWWEGLLACGVIVITGVLLVMIAARLYQGSLLRTGTRTSLRAAWASHRQERTTVTG